MAPALPMQLLRARDAVMQLFRPHLHAVGLTDQQGRIIRVLAEFDRLEMLELAARTSINPASLSRMIPRLHAQGIVRRQKDRRDGRRVTVSITSKGRALFDSIGRVSDHIYAEVADTLGAQGMRQLYRCLDTLIDTYGGDGLPTGKRRTPRRR